jgi:hypothetical protein
MKLTPENQNLQVFRSSAFALKVARTSNPKVRTGCVTCKFKYDFTFK